MHRQSSVVERVVASEVETTVWISTNLATYGPPANGGHGTALGLVITHLRLQSEVKAPNAAPPLTALSPQA